MTPVRTVASLRRLLKEWRADGATVALVPTMGALHDGHRALVDAARERADRVVASLFVNPRQFSPGEDFERYPRNEARDMARFRDFGVDCVYAPSIDAIYGEGFATTVKVAGPGEGLEEEARPGFFGGVATVVLKLLLQSGADVAVFGEKDYQQLLVVTRLVRDLDLEVAIHAVATVREADGLAISSRNAYLDHGQRRLAPRFHATLQEASSALGSGVPPVRALDTARKALEDAFDRVDYLELRDSLGLGPARRSARLLGAVHLGSTRLIDNVPVDLPG